MHFLGRFKGIHQRLDALEQRLGERDAAAIAALSREIKAALAESFAANDTTRTDLTARTDAARDMLGDRLAAGLDNASELTSRHAVELAERIDRTAATLGDRLAADLGNASELTSRHAVELAKKIDRTAATLGDRLTADLGNASELAGRHAVELAEKIDRTAEILRSSSSDLALRLDTAADRHSAELASGLADATQRMDTLATRADMGVALQSLSEALRGEHQELLQTLQRTTPAPEPPAPAKRPLPRPLAGTTAPMRSASLPSVYFIVGCGRSGTTSLARILNRARNGVCHNEPAPVLGHESRLAYEGRLDEPFGALQRVIAPRVVEALDQGLCYGEKNLTLPPFIPYLHALFRCRFVYPVRDGRAVVRSWLDWHNQVYGNIYRECHELGPLSPRALAWVARTPAALDEYDVARPRPLAGDAWHDAWPSLSRLEMVAWHWARTNTIILDALEKLPVETWRRADYSPMDAGTIMDIAGFLGLEGLDTAEVAAMVESRINRLEDMAPDCRRFPTWESWSDHDKAAFDAIATPAMRRLGYYPPDHIRHRPADFAQSWQASDNDSATELAWLAEQLADDPPSLIREACGGAAAGFFPKADIQPIAAAEWIDAPPPGRADLALARGVALAGIYDIEAAIRRLADQSARWLFLSFADSGFDEHRHCRNPVTGRYANAISRRAVEQQLASLGWNVTADNGDRECCALLAHARGLG